MRSNDFLNEAIDDALAGRTPKWFGGIRGAWENRDLKYLGYQIEKYKVLNELDQQIHMNEFAEASHQNMMEGFERQREAHEHEKRVWELTEGGLQAQIDQQRQEIENRRADAEYRLAEADKLLGEGELVRANALLVEMDARLKAEEVRSRRLDTTIRAELSRESVAHGMLPEQYSDFRHKQALKMIDVQALRQEAQIKLDYALAFQSVDILLAERSSKRLKELYDERDELEARTDLPISSLTRRLDNLDVLIERFESATKGYIQGDNWKKLGAGDPDPNYRTDGKHLLAEGEK